MIQDKKGTWTTEFSSVITHKQINADDYKEITIGREGSKKD